MNQTIVCKFGGSSVADASCFRRVRDIITSDARRRYIVVSAPGRRTPEDRKVTDLLYRCHALSRACLDYIDPFTAVRDRYEEIVRTLGLRVDIRAELHRIEKELPRSEEYAASRGEYLCARLLADYLSMPFIDAADIIRFRSDGSLDHHATDRAARRMLVRHGSAVIPGFYGTLPDGSIHTFPRGGSDITGAIIARAADALLYENWTDVPGFLAADPRLIPESRCAATLSYTQMRLLTRAGANVLHPDSILPVAEAHIPTQLKNTFAPRLPGTRISDDVSADLPCLSGRKGYASIELSKPAALESERCFSRICAALQDTCSRADAFFSASDSFRLIVRGSCIDRLEQALHADLPGVRISRRSGLAMAVLADAGRPAEPETFLRAAETSGCSILGMESLAGCGCHIFTLCESGLNGFLRQLHHVLYTL